MVLRTILILALSLGARSGELPEVLKGTSAQAYGSWGNKRRGENGALKRPSELPKKGPGYVFRGYSPERNFGTRELVGLIQVLGQNFQKRFGKERSLYIGDMSQKQGGAIRPHGGHRNGLEADFFFPHCSLNTVENRVSCKDWKELSDREVMDSVRVFRLLMESAQSIADQNRFADKDPIKQIFIGREGLKRICKVLASKDLMKSYGKAVERLSLEKGHLDHFHMRMYCPASSPQCRNGKDPKEENLGCNALAQSEVR